MFMPLGTGEPHCNDRSGTHTRRLDIFTAWLMILNVFFAKVIYNLLSSPRGGKRTVIRIAKPRAAYYQHLHAAKSNISVLTRVYRRTRHAFYHTTSNITYNTIYTESWVVDVVDVYISFGILASTLIWAQELSFGRIIPSAAPVIR